MAEALTLIPSPSARGSSSSTTPAPQPPRPVAAPGRARTGASPRPPAMAYLGIPLNGLPDSTLRALDALGPGWSWGRDEAGNWFVERAGDGEGPGTGARCVGRSLAGAIKVAREAERILAEVEGDEP